MYSFVAKSKESSSHQLWSSCPLSPRGPSNTTAIFLMTRISSFVMLRSCASAFATAAAVSSFDMGARGSSAQNMNSTKHHSFVSYSKTSSPVALVWQISG